MRIRIIVMFLTEPGETVTFVHAKDGERTPATTWRDRVSNACKAVGGAGSSALGVGVVMAGGLIQFAAPVGGFIGAAYADKIATSIGLPHLWDTSSGLLQQCASGGLTVAAAAAGAVAMYGAGHMLGNAGVDLVERGVQSMNPFFKDALSGWRKNKEPVQDVDVPALATPQ